MKRKKIFKSHFSLLKFIDSQFYQFSKKYEYVDLSVSLHRRISCRSITTYIQESFGFEHKECLNNIYPFLLSSSIDFYKDNDSFHINFTFEDVKYCIIIRFSNDLPF